MGRLARFIHFYTDEDEGGKPTPTPEVWKTVAGSIVSFVTSVAYPMRKLLAQIEPQQDLHGYDAPWAAGAGANQWDEQWEGGDISAETGINEGNAQMIRTVGYIPVDANKTYYFFCGSISSTNVRARFYDQNKSYIGYSPAGGTFVQVNESFTPPSGAYYMRFAMQPVYGTTYKNDISVNYPSTVTTYSPYSNECPITGWTGLSGKDYGGADLLAGITFLTGYYWNASGNKSASDNMQYEEELIPVEANMTYALAFTSPNTSNKARIQDYNSSGTFISLLLEESPVIGSNLFFFTTSSNASFIHVSMNKNATNLSVVKANSISVSWQSEAGTVYDGYIDVVSGELVATHKSVSLTDAWAQAGNGAFYLDGKATDGKSGVNDQLYDALCNIYPSGYCGGSTHIGIQHAKTLCVQNLNGIRFIVYDTSWASVADFNSYVAQNPIQIVYKLAQPLVYQLTPQQISTLLGNNTVFVDTGSIEVEYLESGLP